MRITEEGRLYALQIREALQHIADATRMVQIKPRTTEVTGDAPLLGCHWLLPRLARFQARHPQIAVRLLTSTAVVNLQQEGIDLAIRMGQGDWEGMESRRLFADEQLVVAAPAIAAVTCRPPRRRSPPAILFFHGVWNTGAASGAEKPIVPAGLRLNDSNLVLEAVRWGRRGAGRRSTVAGAIARGELVQLTAVTVPTPALLANRLPAGGEPAGSRPVHRRLEEEIALWRQQISV